MSKVKIHLTPEQTNTVEKWFKKFCCDVCKEIVKICKKSFITAEQVGNSWRENIEYSVQNEDFIKLYSCGFLKSISEDVPEFRNTDLLIALARKISAFLAVYTARANLKPDFSSEEKAKEQHNQYIKLFRVLYNEHKALQKGILRHKREDAKFTELQEKAEQQNEISKIRRFEKKPVCGHRQRITQIVAVKIIINGR